MIPTDILVPVLRKHTDRAKAAINNPSILEKMLALTECVALLTALSLDKQVDKLKGISTHMAVQGANTTEINKWLNGYNSTHQNFFQKN
jgi:hypothetical protein